MEFSRQPRTLSEMDRWKAAEWRPFLLYTGPTVLLNVLPEHTYKHFLILHVAIRLLASEHQHPELLSYADQLLSMFVQEARSLYGEKCIVYNVHNLTHLVADCRKYGCLDNCSAFLLENLLGQLKKTLRATNKPLQQIIRRVSESKHQQT